MSGDPWRPTGVRILFAAICPSASHIVVRFDSSVAWIAENRGFDHMTAGYELHVLDKQGSRVLADSTEIDSTSLALAVNTLRWIQNGTPMSSTIY
jgi:hypothetical protein